MLTLWIALAFAQDDPTWQAALQAEYRQHHDELVKLASKNRWEGVERHYQALLELGLEVQAEDHLHGAHAARALGDAAAMLERLQSAQSLAPSQETQSWIDEVHSGWTQVSLGTNPATPGVELQCRRKPFAADQRAAIEHAQSVVAETGGFQGWLPPGNYRFAGAKLSLEAGQSTELVQDMAWGGKKVR